MQLTFPTICYEGLYHKYWQGFQTKPHAVFTKEFSLTRKWKIKAHKNFVQIPTPLTNNADIEAHKGYNKIVNNDKEKFNEHIQDNILCFNGSRLF